MRSSAPTRLAGVLAAVLAGLAGIGCGGGDDAATATAAETAPRDVVLVTLDTLRADHVGAYGDTRALTPTLDRLAAEGARFARVTAPVPLTLPSHASLLTGREPYSTGVRINGADRLPPDEETLAEAFTAAGWSTAAFVSAFPVVHRFGLAQGFGRFEDSLASDSLVRFTDEVPGEEVVRRFAAWLDEAAPERYFAWVHLYDPHRPWQAPEPFASRFPDDPYRAEIAYADHALGQLVADLARRGRLERTLLVVTSDHGEGLGDHGEEEHGVFAYEESLRVPLVVRLPGRVAAGTVVEERVALVDVAPTILELAGLAVPATVEGRTLVGLLDGRREAAPELADRAVYFESLLGAEGHGWAPLHGLVRDETKLVRLPEPELYDLRADPGERDNLYARERRRARALADELEAILAAAPAPADADRAMSAEERQRLAALGYASPGAGAAPSGLDPKVAMPLHERLEDAEALAHRGQVEAAAEALAAAAADPRARDMPSYYQARFDLERKRGDAATAAEALRQGLERFPELDLMRFQRAFFLFEHGRLAEAEGEAREVLRRTPSYAEAHELLARIAEARGDLATARREIELALELDPRHRGLRRRAAQLRLATGDLERAADLFRSLERDGALDTDGLFLAALLHTQLGDPVTAERLFRVALERRSDPRDRLSWAAFLVQNGRRDEALAEIRALEAHQLSPAERALLEQIRRESGAAGAG